MRVKMQVLIVNNTNLLNYLTSLGICRRIRKRQDVGRDALIYAYIFKQS